MQLTLQRMVITILTVLALCIAGAGVTLAEETSSAKTPAPGPAKPLQKLRDARKNLKDAASAQADKLKQQKLETNANRRANLQSATSSGERRAIIEQAKDARGDLRARASEARAGFKDRLHALVRTHLGAAIARLNVAIRHFEKFVERIESRIEKLSGRGVDTSSVEALLSGTTEKIEIAKGDAQALIDLISTVTDTSDADTVKAEIRAAIQTAKESVKAAHRALKETIRVLVELVRNAKEINTDTSIDEDD